MPSAEPRRRRTGSKQTTSRPAAVVLGLGVTGLGVVRGLAASGIQVYGVSFEGGEDPGRYSRLCCVVDRNGALKHPDQLLNWLLNWLAELGGRPVLIPTSDLLSLFVAEQLGRLSEVARCFANSLASLRQLVCKNQLYPIALDAGVAPPSFLNSPTPATTREWCISNRPPYLLKPIYEQSGTNVLGKKNCFFPTQRDLLEFLVTVDASNLILMRALKGGDGFVFDTYGYCDKEGRVATLGSHRRLRQEPPNVGSTCYGEIPAHPDGHDPGEIFVRTLRLLHKVKYHGIFGIEWLQDQASNELFVLDFNARPFTTIGHLCDAGLNLPSLAYLDLCGQDVASFPERPELKHLYWIDFNRDISSFRARHREGQMSVASWLISVLRTRSFACWKWTDPGPAIYQLLRLCERTINKLLRLRSPVRAET